MTDKTHQLIGFSAATATIMLQQPSLPITWSIVGTVIIGSFIGSIAPDIDQPTSNFWDSVPLGGTFSKIVPRALGGHRNISHSLLGIGLFYLVTQVMVSWLPSDRWLDLDLFQLSAMIGFVAHLLGDAITVQGIPLLWPFGRNVGIPPEPLEGIRIVTGKWFENFVVLPGTAIILGLFLWQHSERLCEILPLVCR